MNNNIFKTKYIVKLSHLPTGREFQSDEVNMSPVEYANLLKVITSPGGHLQFTIQGNNHVFNNSILANSVIIIINKGRVTNG